MTQVKSLSTKTFVILALMSAILLLMAYTPLGYLNIGPLAITFNMIPVAVAAAACGAFGGAFAAAVFGLTSFMQCLGVGGISAFGATLFSISPIATFVLCFVTRVLDGWLLGLIFDRLRGHMRISLSSAIIGFLAAFLNTLFFMSALILLFGRTDYMQEMIGGRNILVFVCAFVGVNAVFEMIASTILTSAIVTALSKANLLEQR